MKVQVILFRDSGTYYTEEEWEVPETVPSAFDDVDKRPVIGPYDMIHSPDFRRIGNGKVLVSTQEPWGFPHLL